jgi:hypothetical protein
MQLQFFQHEIVSSKFQAMPFDNILVNATPQVFSFEAMISAFAEASQKVCLTSEFVTLIA